MRVRTLAALTSLCAIAAACSTDSGITEPECRNITSQVASTRGDTVITTTGLRYIDIVRGVAPVSGACRAVALRYVGRLTDGAVVDSLPSSQRLIFTIGTIDFIDGFEEGLVGMGVGGQRRLIIPPALGYGPESRQPVVPGTFSEIPPNSTLIFDINVLDVQAPR